MSFTNHILERFLIACDFSICSQYTLFLSLVTNVDKPDFNVAYNTACDTAGKCSPEALIHYILQGAMFKLTQTFEWLAFHNAYLLRAQGMEALKVILSESDRFVSLRNHVGFHENLLAAYNTLIGQKTDAMYAEISASISAYAETNDFSLPYQMIAFSMAIPTFYSDENQYSYNTINERAHDLAGVTDFLSNNTKATVVMSPAVSEYKKAMNALMASQETSAKKFDVTFAVNLPGVPPLTPLDAADFHYEATMAEAHRLFVCSKQNIYLNAKLKLDSFYQFLQNKYFDDFNKELQKSVVTMDESEIATWMDLGFNSTRTWETRNETALLIDDLKTLQSHIFRYITNRR